MLSLLEIGALLLLLQHLLLLLLLLDSEPAGLLDGLGELVAHLLIGLVGGQVQPRGEDNRGSELVHNKDRLPRQGRKQTALTDVSGAIRFFCRRGLGSILSSYLFD